MRTAHQLAPNKVRLIQIAKRRLGLEDEDYRRVLMAAAGVDSSRKLNEDGFRQLMDVFARLGFESTSATANFGRREGFATAGQIAAIRRLWHEYTRGEGTEAGLGHWLEGKWGVSSLRFLQAENGPKVIGALKAMVARRAAKDTAHGAA